MTEEILKNNYNIILDCWKLMKEYHSIEKKDDLKWDKLSNQAQILNDKYRTDFARQMILLTLLEIERTI